MSENDIGNIVVESAITVEGRVILEMKSVEKVTPAHKKQVQTCLRLTGCYLGYPFNFGEALMKNAITWCVNGLEKKISAPLRPGGS
jgi:GxxExxY protein